MKFIVDVQWDGLAPDLPQDDNLAFVSDSQDVDDIKLNFGYHPDVEDFDSFFVVVGDGEYEQVWGMSGIVAYLDKPVYAIRSRLVDEQAWRWLRFRLAMYDKATCPVCGQTAFYHDRVENTDEFVKAKWKAVCLKAEEIGVV